MEKSNALTSSKRLLYIFAYLMITTERSVAYKSGCKGGYCFILSENDELETQDEAQRWCSNNGSRLIEVQNMDIQAAITSFIDPLGGYPPYIMTNGVRRAIPWTRLSGNDIGGITVHEQNDVTYSYGYLRSTGSVFDVYASTPTVYRQGYICSGQIDCTTGGAAAVIDGQCYKSYRPSDSLQWYSARNKCLNMGGDLASFDSITTNAGFNALNGSWLNPSTEYWMGFRRERWTWDGKGDDVRYSQWSSGHPVLYITDQLGCLCLLPYSGYQWTECRCNDPLQFLCISGPTTTTISEKGQDTTSLRKTTPATFATSKRNKATQKYTSDVTADVKANNMKTDLRRYLGIGLGVGLGLIFIIVTISVIILLLRRRGCPRYIVEIPNRKLSLSSEVIIPPSADMHYAVVLKQHEDEMMTTAVWENPTHVEYAELSPSSKQTYAASVADERQSMHASILIGNTATLRPPPSQKTYPNHIAINGYEYATVSKPD